MRRISIFFLGLLISITAFSENLYSFQEEDTLWTNGGNLNLNIQQVGFNNWANGVHGPIMIKHAEARNLANGIWQ